MSKGKKLLLLVFIATVFSILNIVIVPAEQNILRAILVGFTIFLSITIVRKFDEQLKKR